MRWVLAACLFVIPAASFADEGVVNEKLVHMRKAATIQSLDIVWLGRGNRVSILEEDGEWVYVRILIEKGRDEIEINGWLPAQTVKNEALVLELEDPQLDAEDTGWASEAWDSWDSAETTTDTSEPDWLTDG